MDVQLTKKEKRSYILFKVIKYHFDTPLGPITYTINPFSHKFKYSKEFRSDFEIDPYTLSNPRKMRELGAQVGKQRRKGVYSEDHLRQIEKMIRSNAKTLSNIQKEALKTVIADLEEEARELKKQFEEVLKRGI